MNYEIVPYKKREHSIAWACSMSKLSQMIYVPQEPVHSTEKVVRINFKLRKRFQQVSGVNLIFVTFGVGCHGC